MLFGERETTSDFHDNYAMKQKRKGGKQPSAITVITIMWGSGSAWQQFGGLVFQDLCLKIYGHRLLEMRGNDDGS